MGTKRFAILVVGLLLVGTLEVSAVAGAGPGSGTVQPVATASSPLAPAMHPVELSSSATYAVTFTEAGLPSGTNWSVTLGSLTNSSGTATIAFEVVNGTYPYTIPFLPIGTTEAWQATPGSGSVVVAGSEVTVNPAFHEVPLLPLRFFAHDVQEPLVSLPSAELWSVTANGSTKTNVTYQYPTYVQGLVEFLEPNNSVVNFTSYFPGYGLSKVTGAGKNLLSSSSVLVTPYLNKKGKLLCDCLTVDLWFGRLVPVNFVEGPLPWWEVFPHWGVSLLPAAEIGGPLPQSNFTNGTSVAFSVPVDAAYKFVVTGPSEFRVSPSKGLLKASPSSGPLRKPVKFVLLTSVVKFKENGLPRGTPWNVTVLDGTSPTIHYPFGESDPGPMQIVFHLPAGTYNWTATVPGSWTAPVSGTLQVSYPSAPTRVNVAFGAAKAYGCFYFIDSSGVPIGLPICNGNVDINDFLVNFTQLPAPTVCATQFTLGGANDGPSEACPNAASGPANQFEVNWSDLASPPAITSCYWAVSGSPVGSCVVPSPAPDGFVLSTAQITAVAWTADDHQIGPQISAPPGAYGVVFWL